jgi:SAM-dependent methyltransferase
MIARTVSPEDLARLKAAREAADRNYNEALTALDASLPKPSEPPHPPPGPDEHQVTPLNEAWDLRDQPPPPGRGLLARAGAQLWKLVAPFAAAHVAERLARQQAFNSHVVDHVNRNVPVGRATRQSIESTLAYVADQLRALASFQSHLIVYLQQLTPFVDTKDHEFEGLARRLHEDNRELFDLLDHRTVGLGGAISGVGDELAKRWESMVAREQRYDAAVTRLTAAHQDLRSSFAIVQQTQLSLKRELERLRSVPAPAAAPAAATGAPGPTLPPQAPDFQQAGAATIDSYKYVGFEERFRGSQEEITRRLMEYLPIFSGARDLLDLGCGRGEFLELLRDHGVDARGLDLNHEMVELCRARGLRVDEGDAVGFLEALPDGSLGGLFAAQVVEHLQPDYLLRLLDVAYHKLRPGSAIVLETINPACWYAFFSSYIRDLTHVRPIHPETLGYFLQASGFQQVRIDYRAPYPDAEKLRRVAGDDPLREVFNANVDLLNSLLFTYLDYAVVGQRE